MCKKITLGLFIVFITGFIVSCSKHTEFLGGVGHQAGYMTPEVNCTECHGYDLNGEGSVPSCYKCHDKKWE